MHIHGNQTKLNMVNSYSAAAEKAAAAQRAVHMRRMRRERAVDAEGMAGPKAGVAAGGWMHSERYSEAAGMDGVEYHPLQAGGFLGFL
ncbi:MAG: hypothetical protein ACLPY1_13950 [Terracidiphilus sp.]